MSMSNLPLDVAVNGDLYDVWSYDWRYRLAIVEILYNNTNYPIKIWHNFSYDKAYEYDMEESFATLEDAFYRYDEIIKQKLGKEKTRKNEK